MAPTGTAPMLRLRLEVHPWRPAAQSGKDLAILPADTLRLRLVIGTWGSYRLVFVAVAVFVPVCVILPVLTAVAAPPVAVGAQKFAFAAMATPPAPVAVAELFPLVGLQVAVAFPPTATTLTVLLLDWLITLVWRTLLMRTELWWP